MKTPDERLWDLLRARSELNNLVDDGIYTDEETKDTREAIEEEIGEIRRQIAERYCWGTSFREPTPKEVERELQKRRRNEMILERTRNYISMICKNRSKCLEIPDEKWTSSVLEKMSVALPYFQAFKSGRTWYIAASPAALEEIRKRFENKMQYHIERERELCFALDRIEKIGKRKK